MGEHRDEKWYGDVYKNLGMNPFDTDPIFHWRADIISTLIKPEEKVFEFACGGTLIAQKTKCKEYTWSDFLDLAIDNAKRKLSCIIEKRDIEKDLPDWNNYDVIISVSWEHLEKDIDIIKSIPTGKRIIMSCPTIDADDHIRILDTKEKILERYGDLIEIKDYYRNGILQVINAIKC